MITRSSINATLLALAGSYYCNAQYSDFVVTKTNDTIYVDKVSTSDTKVTFKKDGKKEKLDIAEVNSYYDKDKNSHFERVKNPMIDKINTKETNRYDYREQERQHVDDYEKSIPYKFLQRLTSGKVKLFTSGINTVMGGGPGTMATPYSNKQYYIAIYDSKLEPLKTNGDLRLTDDVYEVLKIYLHGNDQILKQLDKLYMSKPKADEKQIAELINAYNLWVKSSK